MLVFEKVDILENKIVPRITKRTNVRDTTEEKTHKGIELRGNN